MSDDQIPKGDAPEENGRTIKFSRREMIRRGVLIGGATGAAIGAGLVWTRPKVESLDSRNVSHVSLQPCPFHGSVDCLKGEPGTASASCIKACEDKVDTFVTCNPGQTKKIKDGCKSLCDCYCAESSTGTCCEGLCDPNNWVLEPPPPDAGNCQGIRYDGVVCCGGCNTAFHR